MPWQVDVCHVLARHAQYTSRFEVCRFQEWRFEYKKTVPLTRINIKNACLATHVNYEKNTLYKENIFEDNTGSRKYSSITHKKY